MTDQTTTSSSTQQAAPSLGFSIVVAVVSAFGYLLATFPPSILDPLLTTHVRFPARQYKLAWLIWPIALCVLLITSIAISRARSRPRAVLASTVPLSLACLASLPIFLPEMPHCNILFVGTIWLCITAGWIWMRATPPVYEKILADFVERNAQIEYIKEQLTFYRTLFFGLVAAYLSLIVTAFTTIHGINKAIATNDGQVFLMNINSNTQMSCISIFLLTTIFRELYKKHELLSNLFASIRRNEKQLNDGPIG